MKPIECEQKLTNDVGFKQRIGYIGWNYYSFQEVIKVKGEDKTQEQIIKELRQKVAELEKLGTQCERDVEKLLVIDNEPRVIIGNHPQRIFSKDENSTCMLCNKSYTYDLKIKPEEIKAYLEFFYYETK